MRTMVKRAINLAASAHNGQTRKDGVTPYIVHPARVADAVAFHAPMVGVRNRDLVLSAAWLHDVLEDTDVTVDKIRSISVYMASIVNDLTNPPNSVFPGMNRRQRKTEIALSLAECSLEVRMIKVLDRLDNLSDFDGMDEGFKKVYARESVQLFDAIVKDDLWMLRPNIAVAMTALSKYM
jgi:(p)ppGpp synthase/HD superfamily hydrolase